MTAVVLRVELTEQPIELSEHEALVAHESAGAVVGFAGVVRDHDDGRTVIRLEYSAHPSAQQTLADVVAEIAADCHGVRAIAVSHRVARCRSATRHWWLRSPRTTERQHSRRASGWSTTSRPGYRCGSTSSSPTAPTSG